MNGNLRKNRLGKWLYLGFVALLAACLVLAGCSSNNNNNGGSNTGNTGNNVSTGEGEGASSGPKSGGTLKLGIATGLVNVGNVPKTRSTFEVFVGNAALETLGRYTETGEIVPHLAEGWETDTENNTITYSLKQGVKFHDGTDFNAEAVKFNADKMIEFKRSEFANLESVDVLDPYTVRFNLKQWDSSFVEVVANFLWIMSPTAYEELGQDGITFQPVGTGPFKFEKYEPDVGMYFTKFEDYWQEGKPYLDRLEIMIYGDPTTARFSLESGEIDGIWSTTPRDASELKDNFNVLTLQSGLGALARGIITDHGDPNSPFQDVRVRKALGHAIDADAIIDSLMFGFAIRTNQWGAPTAWSYNPDVEGTPYDPEKAKQLLAEAGYPDGFKTKMTTLNNQDDQTWFTAMQAYLADVGIEAEIEVIDEAKFREITMNPGEFDGIIAYNFRGDADLSLYMPRNFTPNGVLYANNLSHPPVIEELLNQAKVATTQEEKRDILFQVQKEVWDNHAMAVPMWVTTNPSVLKNNIHDTGINRTYMTVWEPENAWIE